MALKGVDTLLVEILKALGVVVVLLVVSYASFKLGLKEKLKESPLFFPELKETQFGYYEDKYIIYKIFNGYALEMEDAKNAVQSHSRLEELKRGENTKLQFEYDFESGQYVLSKELGKVIDSTDDFY